MSRRYVFTCACCGAEVAQPSEALPPGWLIVAVPRAAADLCSISCARAALDTAAMRVECALEPARPAPAALPASRGSLLEVD